MFIVKAEANQIERIVDMSIRAFETDVNVGGAGGPATYQRSNLHFRQKDVGDMPQRRAAVRTVISRLR